MFFSNRASILIVLLVITVGDTMGTVQAEDNMPPTIDIVPRLRRRGTVDFVSDPVQIDTFPVPTFYIRGDFGEEKGNIYPVIGFDWSLQATPDVLPDNRLLLAGSRVRGLDENRMTSGHLKEGQLIPLCGHVYRFSRTKKAGLLTLLADHPLHFNPKDKARYFSVSGSFKWGNDVDYGASHGRVVSGNYDNIRGGENGRLSIERYTTLSKSETAAVVSFSSFKKEGKYIDTDQALKFKLDRPADKRGGRVLKVDDHIQTDEFDFIVRRIIPPDGKDNPGWIDLELLTGAPPEAQDKKAVPVP